LWIVHESHVQSSDVVQTDTPRETLKKRVQFWSAANDIFRYYLLNRSSNIILKSIY
jgi:hypothetical protein